MMIKQRKSTDCGIATLANLLSVEYEQALKLYGTGMDRTGVTIQHTASILFSLGYAPIYVTFPGFEKAAGIKTTPATPSILETSGHPAILQVITASGMIHQVFFDGKNIHDPNPTTPYPRQIADYCLVDALFVINQGQAFVRKPGLCPCESYNVHESHTVNIGGFV